MKYTFKKPEKDNVLEFPQGSVDFGSSIAYYKVTSSGVHINFKEYILLNREIDDMIEFLKAVKVAHKEQF